jgi:hypothetical protein
VPEHDPERPWVIVGSGRHRVELEAGIDFYEWVREQWPADRFTVELDVVADAEVGGRARFRCTRITPPVTLDRDR